MWEYPRQLKNYDTMNNETNAIVHVNQLRVLTVSESRTCTNRATMSEREKSYLEKED